MNFRKANNNTWTDATYYIRKTATDNIITLPIAFYGDGTSATVAVNGQSSQTSTPSPQNPIDINGVGEMSANLTNVNTFTNSETTDSGRDYFNAQLRLSNGTYTNLSITKTGHYKLSIGNVGNTTVVLRHSGQSKNIKILEYIATFSESQTVTVSFDVEGYDPENLNGLVLNNIMLNVGSDELPYAPYGQLVIPITKDNVTTNYALGNIQSIRKIKKLVFDGTEEWGNYISSASGIGATLTITDMLSNGRINGYCTHFVTQNSPAHSSLNGITFGASNQIIYITFSTDTATALNLTDTTSIKTWLASEYANGTPVTIYYVLATPETATLNESLMGVSDYSDSISASIPTTDGANSINVPTTLQPSSVDVNYHGWHPMSDVHEYHVGTNLIDCAIENGGYNAATGEKISGDYYRTADYIAVEPNTDYIFGRGGVSLAVYVCLYTSDKTFIERLYPRRGQYFTTSESTHYITMYRSNNETSEQWQLNKGQSILPYEAYYEPYWE